MRALFTRLGMWTYQGRTLTGGTWKLSFTPDPGVMVAMLRLAPKLRRMTDAEWEELLRELDRT